MEKSKLYPAILAAVLVPLNTASGIGTRDQNNLPTLDSHELSVPEKIDRSCNVLTDSEQSNFIRSLAKQQMNQLLQAAEEKGIQVDLPSGCLEKQPDPPSKLKKPSFLK